MYFCYFDRKQKGVDSQRLSLQSSIDSSFLSIIIETNKQLTLLVFTVVHPDVVEQKFSSLSNRQFCSHWYQCSYLYINPKQLQKKFVDDLYRFNNGLLQLVLQLVFGLIIVNEMKLIQNVNNPFNLIHNFFIHHFVDV